MRLPLAVDADPEPGRSRPDPRTELTHQVPGRRPRPAPTIAEPADRREAVRDWCDRTVASTGGRVAIAALVVAALVVAGCAGLRPTGAASEAVAEPRASEAAAASDLPETTAPAPVVPAVDDAPLADRQEEPATSDGWATLVSELYERRARAFATASAEEFADVYTVGSPLRRPDEQHAGELEQAGEVLRGFAPVVVSVTGVSGSGDLRTVDLTDRWPGFDVAPAGDPDGAALRSVPGRPDAGVRMVLVRTPDGWRIDSAERLP